MAPAAITSAPISDWRHASAPVSGNVGEAVTPDAAVGDALDEAFTAALEVAIGTTPGAAGLTVAAIGAGAALATTAQRRTTTVTPTTRRGVDNADDVELTTTCPPEIATPAAARMPPTWTSSGWALVQIY